MDAAPRPKSASAIPAIILALVLTAMFVVVMLGGLALIVLFFIGFQSAPMQVAALPAAPPQPTVLQSAPVEPIEIQLDKTGSIEFEGEALTLEQWDKRLSEIHDEQPERTTIRLVADPQCPHSKVVEILDIGNRHGDFQFNLEMAEAKATDNE